MQVLTGLVELRAGGEVDPGSAGDVLAIPPRPHSLAAIEDSAVPLTVSKAPS